MSKNDGGPAFPLEDALGADFKPRPYSSHGMSLRDWFAGQALVGLLSRSTTIKFNGKEMTGESEFSEAAYIWADAMLEARSE